MNVCGSEKTTFGSGFFPHTLQLPWSKTIEFYARI